MPIFSVILLTAPPPGVVRNPNGPFVKVDGRESLLRAVELFLNREPIKQIQLVFTHRRHGRRQTHAAGISAPA